jgi:hypothetical protein
MASTGAPTLFASVAAPPPAAAGPGVEADTVRAARTRPLALHMLSADDASVFAEAARERRAAVVVFEYA